MRDSRLPAPAIRPAVRSTSWRTGHHLPRGTPRRENSREQHTSTIIDFPLMPMSTHRI
jgi:hypothetical protein